MVDGSLIAKIMMMEGNMMTEKRFETNMRLVIDTEKKYGARVLNAEEVVDLLNTFNEENEQLKSENNLLRTNVKKLTDDVKYLAKLE